MKSATQTASSDATSRPPYSPLRVLTDLWHHLDSAAPWIAAAACLLTLFIGIYWNVSVAWGCDGYAYVSQAALWEKGTLHTPQPIASEVPWRDADWTFSPLGYRPGRIRGTIVPVMPPGLPLLMAAAMKIGGAAAVYFVVPILGAIAVWVTYLLGRALDSRIVGMLSAVILSLSPIFLFQVIQPMTDVPATAWWLIATVLTVRGTTLSAALGGLAASAAILTRPNLGPLAVLLALFLLCGVIGRREGETGGRLRRTACFCLALIPGCLLLAWINARLYGAPWALGHGVLEDFFSRSYIHSNSFRYHRWLLESQTEFIYLTLITPLAASLPIVRRHTESQISIGLAWASLAIVAVVVASYLPYLRFTDWSFLRFLLPALPFMIALSSASAVSWIRLFPVPARALVLVTLCAFLGYTYLQTASNRQVFTMWMPEHRYVEVGQYVAAHLPERAVIVSMQHSGSIRHYSGRITLRWDYLDSRWLDRALEFLTARGYPPYIVLERFEERLFKDQFQGQRFGALDWMPMAQLTDHYPVRIYNPADRLAARPEKE